MVEHDEARHNPHHEEAHIARLVACERRHTKTRPWRRSRRQRRAAVARGGVTASWRGGKFSDETAIHTRQGGDLPTSTVAVKGEAKVGKV
eukprot:scaffold91433_cov56-Phaeocystis_antarctica.AAC.2